MLLARPGSCPADSRWGRGTYSFLNIFSGYTEALGGSDAFGDKMLWVGNMLEAGWLSCCSLKKLPREAIAG